MVNLSDSTMFSNFKHFLIWNKPKKSKFKMLKSTLISRLLLATSMKTKKKTWRNSSKKLQQPAKVIQAFPLR